MESTFFTSRLGGRVIYIYIYTLGFECFSPKACVFNMGYIACTFYEGLKTAHFHHSWAQTCSEYLEEAQYNTTEQIDYSSALISKFGPEGVKHLK